MLIFDTCSSTISICILFLTYLVQPSHLPMSVAIRPKSLGHFEGGNISTKLPSLKLTWPLKMEGWNMNFLLGRPIFRGEVLVSGFRPFREGKCHELLATTSMTGRSLYSPRNKLEANAYGQVVMWRVVSVTIIIIIVEHATKISLSSSSSSSSSSPLS